MNWLYFIRYNIGVNVKRSLQTIAKEVDERLGIYWKRELKNGFGYSRSQKRLVKRLLLHASEHNLRTGKRLRGAFVYYGYLLGGKMNEEVWKAVCGVELVHTALLMHDDFMDRDELRRGKPTTHRFFANGDEHFGNSMAVDLGDVVLCLGYEELMSMKLKPELVLKSSKQMMRAIVETAYGQAHDVYMSKINKWSEEDVLAIHRAKTAIYTIENPLLIGALLWGASEEIVKIIKEYSVDAGMAFQLQDDVIGVFGDKIKTGKSSNSDILQGKRTLLALKTLEMGDRKQKEDFIKVWGNLEANTKEINLAKLAIRNSGAYEYNLKMAKGLALKAARIGKKLYKLGLNKEAVDFIVGVAEYLVEREV